MHHHHPVKNIITIITKVITNTLTEGVHITRRGVGDWWHSGIKDKRSAWMWDRFLLPSQCLIQPLY